MNKGTGLASLVLAAACCLSPAAASAVSLEDHATIRAAAGAHAEMLAAGLAPADATVRVSVAQLDSRLRLPDCPVGLRAFTAQGQTGMPTSIGVRCEGDVNWSLYVPVRVEVVADVLVLAVPATRGESLTPDMVRIEPRDVARISGAYLTDAAAIEDKVLRRPARAGTVLNDTWLEAEKVIRRGERVKLETRAAAFSVHGEGEALADAAAGDHVRVRNVDSGLIVEGIANSPGLVLVRR